MEKEAQQDMVYLNCSKQRRRHDVFRIFFVPTKAFDIIHSDGMYECDRDSSLDGRRQRAPKEGKSLAFVGSSTDAV